MRLMIITILAILGLMFWLGYSEQSALEQCKQAGVQSNATCEFYAK